jgi:hypothetical protein
MPDEIASCFAENTPRIVGEVGHNLSDHQFSLLDGAQF